MRSPSRLSSRSRFTFTANSARHTLGTNRKADFKDARPEEILSVVSRAAYTRAYYARMAALNCGISHTTPLNPVVNQIIVGRISFGIRAGVELMTYGWGSGPCPMVGQRPFSPTGKTEDRLIPMGITSGNVATTRSLRKAAVTQGARKFKAIADPKGEKEAEIDAGIDSLAKLKPSFKRDGSTHAGNVLQVSDGAAAVVSARRSIAERLGLPILDKYVAASVVGVPPRITGVGLAYAIPKLLGKAGLPKDDIDLEAFASWSIEKIDIPFGNVKPIEHPLECTETRQISTGLSIAAQGSESVCHRHAASALGWV
ncbi:hypothetical protein EDD16DRAFT_1755985 [Pisolithus croceorrhizus]|nr:hypothetical protein EDD16DRAFT_1755985 [Pisolithus croceorrhizus]